MLFQLVLILISILVAGEPSGRLDPHGARDMDLKKILITEHTECKTCHFNSTPAGALKTKPDSSERCLSCHNSSPHSGIAEHIGKIQKWPDSGNQESINCMSCHRTHRGALTELEKRADDFFSKKDHPATLFKRACTDCHQWKK